MMLINSHLMKVICENEITWIDIKISKLSLDA